MVAETLPQIVRMWKDEDYSYDGKFFSMPSRNVLPKPYSKPHPAIWMAAGSPSTFDLAAELGVGVLCFGFSTPDQLTPLVARYKEKIGDCKNPVGGFVNDNVMITTTMICMEDGAKARKTFLEADSNYHLSLVFRYLDTFPKPPGVPEWPAIVPAMDAASLDSVIASGDVAVGTPDEVNKAIERYVATGRRPAVLRHAVELHVDRVLRGSGRDVRQAPAAGLRQGPDPQHHQAAARRRRFLSSRSSFFTQVVGFQPELAGRGSDGRSPRPPRRGRALPRRPGGAPRRRGVRTGPRGPRPRLRRPMRRHAAARPAVHDPLLHHVDRCPQHGVVQRDAAACGGGHEQVEHERVEDALGHADVALGGEGAAGLGRRVQHGAVLRVRLGPPRVRRHRAEAWRRTSRGRGRPTARGGRPPAAPPWSCRSRANRSGGAGARCPARSHLRVGLSRQTGERSGPGPVSPAPRRRPPACSAQWRLRIR